MTDATEVLRLAMDVARGEGLPPPEVTRRAARMAARMASRPTAALREGLEQVLLAERADAALEWLRRCGFVAAVLPELQATVDFAQEVGRRHKDVWKHTRQVVAQASPRPALRWAALLHDVGKVPTRRLLPSGKVTFHGHAQAGARMFDDIARRLAFPAPLAARVRFLVAQHLRASQYRSSWSDSAVRRFDRQAGDHLDDLLALSRADVTSARPQRRARARAQIDELAARVTALRQIDARRPPLPSGLGRAIMAALALPPGPEIGAIKAGLERAIARGELEPHREDAHYVAYLLRSAVDR